MPSIPNLIVRPAKPADLDLILSFIQGLAAYERLSDQVSATPSVLRAALFPKGRRPAVECLLAFVGKAPAGFAVFYPNFSTFLGRPGLFLEDIFVHPDFRRRGVGRALWTAVATTAAQRDCQRMDWLVLSWNKKAQRFYRTLGARHHPTWTLCRIDGASLARYAAKPPSGTATPRKARRTASHRPNVPLKRKTP